MIKLTVNENNENLVNINLTPAQWRILSLEIIKQDQEDSCILNLEKADYITTEESETDDNFWASYNPETGIATFYKTTIDEYLAGNYCGEEGSVLLESVEEPTAELVLLITDLQAARKA